LALFQDRTGAGRELAAKLADYTADALVLALPRGGVPVGFEVANALGVPLDVLLVRKLGAPVQEELAMGAIASAGVSVINDDVIRALHVSEQEIAAVVEQEEKELFRRHHLYRGERPFPKVENSTVMLIDDGVATGATMRVAILVLRQQNPKRIVVAVPVGAADTCEMLRHEADEVVCTATPTPFYAIGQWYQSFPQVSDDEVRDLLSRMG
jgi:putative phosphoribosyl transferase